MAYVQIESDDRMEEGPERLQFQSFLSTDARAANQEGGNGAPSSGYFSEGPAKPSGFWQLEYYQPYFDVDTKTVLRRCYTTLLPHTQNYLSAHLTPSADLYGPFWTLTTLIFSLFVFSSLASSISAYLSDPADSSAAVVLEYDFGLLSTAVGLVYAYGLGVPVLLWLALRYLGVGEWSVIEAVAVWGYGQFVWIPVALLNVIPVPIVRWVLTGVASLISGWFLVANVYPILATADAKPVRLIIIVLAAMHAAVALCFQILFFSYYPTGAVGPKDPIATLR
ncbi:Yip1-domain-containing protein [Epithele typhae]|uniref:Yip1-domain-containing protein n=1 Tax=Epithele typhae TaxID=378194 RepID=UPI0020089DC8|nr:Yip1-domain-containing protein [Epithele typhae]KAH9943095.1 Yip1-domain-containing protein [Epithele typhae]